MKRIHKSIELYDAKISFVSLVDRPANRRPFLLTKQEGDGSRQAFRTEGKILKSDDAKHDVTGVAYEPMVADTDDNFMTPEQIENMAHWFMKHGRMVDEQHNFEVNPNCQIVESWIAPEDTEIGGSSVTAGTWLVKVEVKDDAVWSKIQNGELTGFSIGGLASYGTEEVALEEGGTVEKNEKRGLLASIAKALGFGDEASAIEKGKVQELYQSDMTAHGFWAAWQALNGALGIDEYDHTKLTKDPQTIYDALKDFCEIVTELLVQPAPTVATAIAADAGVSKAGRKMSTDRLSRLKAADEVLHQFISELSEICQPSAAWR